MRLYQTAQRDLTYLGIGPYDPDKENHLNPMIFLYILLCVLSFTLTGAYLFIEAKTFDEITQCIYIISASILSPMAVGSLAIQQKTLFNLIGRIEAIFDSSK